MLKAVVFDLYETLVTQFDPGWKPPKMSVAERLGIEEEAFQCHWKPLAAGWRKGRPHDYEKVIEAVCKAAGITPDGQVIADLARERRESRLPPFENVEPGIVEMVDGLGRRGLKLGVVTNAASGDVEPWPHCRLAPRFEAFVASYRVGMLKPDPRIYERCLEALGVSASEAVFVGDAANEGINELEGAVRVGLRPFWATWFLDRWPPGTRQMPEQEPPFPRLRTTTDLLDAVLGDLYDR